MRIDMEFALLAVAVVFALSAQAATSRSNRDEPVPGAGQFGIELLSNFVGMSKNLENSVMSPLSLQLALSILLPGARGRTEEKMKDFLKVGTNLDNYYASMQEVHNLFKKSKQLRVASTVFFSEEVKLLDSYKGKVRSYFNTDLEPLNFGDPQNAANVINEWCSKHTAGLIPNIISPKDITPDTLITILNAIYFKAEWINHFHEFNTKDEDFVTHRGGQYSRATEKIKVQMMHSVHPWNCMFNNHHEGLDAQILQLEYKSPEWSRYDPTSPIEKYRMVIILPRKTDGIMNTIIKLQEHDLPGIMKTLKYQRVIVSLPKFKQEIKIDLNAILKKWGLGEIFGHPNFEGLSKKSVSVGNVVQKAIISVAENGTEAAAVTMVDVMKSMQVHSTTPPPPMVFTADHPFIYFIMPEFTVLPIFQGVVMKPKFKENKSSRHLA